MRKLDSTGPCDRPVEGLCEQQSNLRLTVSTKARNLRSTWRATIRFSQTLLHGNTNLWLQKFRLSYRKVI